MVYNGNQPCPCPGCPSPCFPGPCCSPCVPFSCPCPTSSCGANKSSNGAPELDAKGCPKKQPREKRWPQCNFLKPCIDTRLYRDGEFMCISFAGHIPGEQFISGRNLPTTTTFAKRRLCTYTPYEFVDPDGCCSFCSYP